MNQMDPVVRLRLVTSLGPIGIELFPERAPLTVAAYLSYVDDHQYQDSSFWRSVRMDNDHGTPPIQVLQAGPPSLRAFRMGISHEDTRRTGLTHEDGAISLARSAVGSASPHHFFICVGDQPCLDFGGARQPDGLGFAAFGRVTRGMPLVRSIHAARTGAHAELADFGKQVLLDPVPILLIDRETP